MDPRRQRLLSERDEVRRRLSEMTSEFHDIVDAARDTNADDEHDPEGATIAFERSQAATLVDQVRHHLAELDAALDRVESGSYGTCERCGGSIPDARLEAKPTARILRVLLSGAPARRRRRGRDVSWGVFSG